MASHPEWNERTTATEVASTFADQIHGKTSVSPKSLGESLTISIASASPSLLILASRSMSKITAVMTEIQSLHPPVKCHPVILDLSSQSCIRTAAAEISTLAPTIDILINNAGVMVPTRQSTAEGIELQFGTNYLGPFLLTNLLLPQILSAAAKPGAKHGSTRIINVTSGGHRISPIRFSDFNLERKTKDLPIQERPAEGLPETFLPKEGETYSGFVAYGQSKTGNILFSLELSIYLGDQGVSSYAVHPGSIWTDLSRNLSPELAEVIAGTGSGFWKSQDQGAATMLVAAFDPKLELERARGVYLSDCQLTFAAHHAADVLLAGRLWKLSEGLVGERFDIGGGGGAEESRL